MSSRQSEKEKRRAERLEAERRADASEQRRRRIVLGGGAAAALVAAVVVIVLVAGGGSDSATKTSSTATPGTSASTASLPGAQTGPPPWGPGTDQLEQRLQAIGLPALPAEGTVLHTHQHLDLYVDGKQVTVPAAIGIGPTFISPLHTHDTRGVLHVESEKPRTFTLGQFFGVWGVPLSRTQIGGLQAKAGGKQLRAWVNGNPFSGDPASIELTAHEEIALAYGTKAQMPKPVPASYAFAPGE